MYDGGSGLAWHHHHWPLLSICGIQSVTYDSDVTLTSAAHRLLVRWEAAIRRQAVICPLCVTCQTTIYIQTIHDLQYRTCVVTGMSWSHTSSSWGSSSVTCPAGGMATPLNFTPGWCSNPMGPEHPGDARSTTPICQFTATHFSGWHTCYMTRSCTSYATTCSLSFPSPHAVGHTLPQPTATHSLAQLH